MRSECSQKFLYNVNEVQQGSALSQRFAFSSSEVKHHSKLSQTFPFNNSDKVKERSGRSYRFHFNGRRVKQGSD